MPNGYITNVVNNSTLFTRSSIEKHKIPDHNHTEITIFHKLGITIDLSKFLLKLLILI